MNTLVSLGLLCSLAGSSLALTCWNSDGFKAMRDTNVGKTETKIKYKKTSPSRSSRRWCARAAPTSPAPRSGTRWSAGATTTTTWAAPATSPRPRWRRKG